jgi:pantoate kinase
MRSYNEVMDSIFKFFQKKTATDSQEIFLKEPNLRRLQAWGQSPQEGSVKMQFLLPIPANAKAIEAAKRYAEKLGLLEVEVLQMLAVAVDKSIAAELTYFSVSAKTRHVIDYSKLREVASSQRPLCRESIEEQARQSLPRRLNIVGITLGAEGPTLEMDALLSWQGYMGDPWLRELSLF